MRFQAIHQDLHGFVSAHLEGAEDGHAGGLGLGPLLAAIGMAVLLDTELKAPQKSVTKNQMKNFRICQLRPSLARRHSRIFFRMMHRLEEQTLIRLPRHHSGTGH